MEALRHAMHTEGPTPGHIKLHIERTVGPSSGSTPEPYESSQSSGVTVQLSATSDEPALSRPDTLALKKPEMDRPDSRQHEPQPSTTLEEAIITPVGQKNVMEGSFNPVIDRITGGGSKLR